MTLLFGVSAHAETPLRISASGDILLHIKVNESAQQKGWDNPFKRISPLIADSDLALANLETPLSSAHREVVTGSPPTLGSFPAAAGAIAEAGFHALACANNHSYDQKSAGLADTLQALRKAKLAALGAGNNIGEAAKPKFFMRQGKKIALLAVTQGINRGPGFPRLANIVMVRERDIWQQNLKEARKQADVVIMMVHWSHDFAPAPSRWQKKLAKEFVQYGADLIIGTGPHILQPVERLSSPRGDAIVAYSLGNLLSNQGQRYSTTKHYTKKAHPAMWLPESRDGALLHMDIRFDKNRLSIELQADALWTFNNSRAFDGHHAEERNIFVAPLTKNSVIAKERWSQIRKALGPDVHLQQAR